MPDLGPAPLLTLGEAISCLALDPSGRLLLVATASGGSALVQLDRGHSSRLPDAAGVATAATWHGSGEVAAWGTSAGALVLHSCDLASVEVVSGLGFVTDLAWRPAAHGPPLLAVAAGSAVLLFDATGATLGCWPDVRGTVNALAWAPGPTPLAAGAVGGIAWLDVDRPGQLTTWFEAEGMVTTLALDPAGTRLAAGDASGQVRVTDLAGGQELALDGYPDRHRMLTWRADGSLVLVADDEASVWPLQGVEAVDCEPILLRGHDESITDLATRSDGLVTGGSDGRVQWWPPSVTSPPDPVLALQADAPVTSVAAASGGSFEATTVAGTLDGEVFCG